MAGISSKAAGKLENRYKFNDGTELNSDLDIDFYETSFRSLDPQIGRFWQIDPLSTFIFSKSTYGFASNDPISKNDPLGLKDSIINGQHMDYKLMNPEVLAPAKMRPSFSANDLLYTLVLFSPFAPLAGEEGINSAKRIYATGIDYLSDGMPNPPVIGGPSWMHKKWRLQAAKDFVKYSVESLMMLIPGLDAMIIEEEAVALLIEEGVISKEIAIEIATKGGVELTAHGAERIAGAAATRGGVLSMEEVGAIKSLVKTPIIQGDGAQVFIHQVSPGRFSGFIQNQNTGKLITTMNNWSKKSINKMGKNHGWSVE